MKIDWRAVTGVAISALLLWWVFRGEDPGTVLQEFAKADPWLLLAAVVVTTLGFLVRAFRWKVLLYPVKPDTTLHSRFAAVNIGFMANNLLPARVGEFARVYALGRLERVSMSGTFGSLVVERFLDAVALLLLMFVALASPSFPADATVAGEPIALAVQGVMLMVGLVLAAIVVFLVWPRRVVQFGERLARALPEKGQRLAVDTLEAFLDGLTMLRNPRLLLIAMAWSVGFWAWNAFSFWLGFLAFGIHVDFAAALLVQGVVALAVAIPSSPGFFGVFEAGSVVGLTEVYGVARSSAVSFAIGYHLASFIPVTAMGLYYAWRLGMSVSEMKLTEEVVEEAVEMAHPPPALDAGE